MRSVNHNNRTSAGRPRVNVSNVSNLRLVLLKWPFRGIFTSMDAAKESERKRAVEFIKLYVWFEICRDE